MARADATPPAWMVIAGNSTTGWTYTGPYPTEDAAEDARADLELDGGETSFVAPLEPPDAP